ncbi:hypothetical protein [Calycomorphotria hydatis]|nr:hypothetical protein [Calycomorphotria hydatis]
MSRKFVGLAAVASCCLALVAMTSQPQDAEAGFKFFKSSCGSCGIKLCGKFCGYDYDDDDCCCVLKKVFCAPSCAPVCAPEPVCTPAPACCAPAPTCCAPAPTCAAPAPACATCTTTSAPVEYAAPAEAVEEAPAPMADEAPEPPPVAEKEGV